MTEKPCEHIIEKIPLLLDNQLTEQEKEALLCHIRSCPECMTEYTLFQKTKQLTKQLSAPLPSCDFHARLMRAIEKDAKKPALRPKAFFYRKIAGFAAAAAVLALSVASYVSMQNGFSGGQTENVTVPSASPSIDAAITPPAQASLAPENSEPAPKASPNTPPQEPAFTPTPKAFAKEPSVAATHITETTQDAPLPAATSHEKSPDCKVYLVFVDESALPLAEEKLQGLAKDENGYRIETEIAPLLSELSALSGYRTEEATSSNGVTYIQLFTNQ